MPPAIAGLRPGSGGARVGVMTSRVLRYLFTLAVTAGAVHAAAVRVTNTDESKVLPYTLPDPLVCADGTKVRDAATWRSKRRAELLELFSREVYGRTPKGPAQKYQAEVTSIDRAALGGKAVRKEVTIWFTETRDGPKMHLLMYQPVKTAQTRGPWPSFLELNFAGNHAVRADSTIALSTAWMRKNDEKGIVNNRATEASRGASASRFPVETIIARGYAVTTIYYGDLCPDLTAGLAESAGVAPLFSPKPGAEERADDAWGAIGVWAWGLSRALDYLETDAEFDAKRVAVLGHSRLGKTSLWAGAQDERFALVISNDSGCGGAALSKRNFGETVGIINKAFPHWFAKNFRRYNDNEAALPIDQHELIALMAPRPVYVASAAEDSWADPLGEFLSLKGAEPVYRLFAKKAPELGAMPPVDRPVAAGPLGYHIRTGKHDITAYDWAQYLNFADQHLRAR